MLIEPLRYKKLGLEPIMISGDNKNTVRNVAEKLKIDNFLAEVLPQEKQNEVIKLQKEIKKLFLLEMVLMTLLPWLRLIWV